MTAEDTLRTELDHILEMCHEIGNDEIGQVFYKATGKDMIPIELWKQLLAVQDVIREQIHFTEKAQIKLERKRQAMIILNRYIAAVISYHVSPRVVSSKWGGILRDRRRKLFVTDEHVPGCPGGDRDTLGSPSGSSGDEEIVYRENKRSRSD